MEHYVCIGGCKGVTSKPGICRNHDCPNYNEPLEKCDCEDSLHYGAFEMTEDESGNNEE